MSVAKDLPKPFTPYTISMIILQTESVWSNPTVKMQYVSISRPNLNLGPEEVILNHMSISETIDQNSHTND